MNRKGLTPAVLVLLSAGISAAQSPSSVPFVGCQSTGQVFQEAPTGVSPTIPLPPATATRLAYYATASGLSVLAPRGWHCQGIVGSAGDELFVTPQPLNTELFFSDNWTGLNAPAVHVIRRFGGTSGRFATAEVILRFFPAYKPRALELTSDFPEWMSSYPCGKLPTTPYPGDRLTYKSKTLIEYTTPPHADGLGTLWGFKKGNNPITGTAIFIDPDVVILQISLPPGPPQLSPVIIHQFESTAERLRI